MSHQNYGGQTHSKWITKAFGQIRYNGEGHSSQELESEMNTGAQELAVGYTMRVLDTLTHDIGKTDSYLIRKVLDRVTEFLAAEYLHPDRILESLQVGVLHSSLTMLVCCDSDSVAKEDIALLNNLYDVVKRV